MSFTLKGLPTHTLNKETYELIIPLASSFGNTIASPFHPSMSIPFFSLQTTVSWECSLQTCKINDSTIDTKCLFRSKFLWIHVTNSQENVYRIAIKPFLMRQMATHFKPLFPQWITQGSPQWRSWRQYILLSTHINNLNTEKFYSSSQHDLQTPNSWICLVSHLYHLKPVANVTSFGNIVCHFLYSE